MPTPKPLFRKPSKLWLALALITFLLAGFIELTIEMLGHDEKIVWFDRELLIWVASARSDALNGIMVDLTALGSPAIVTLLASLFFIVFLLLKDRVSAFHLLGAVIGGSLLNRLFKSAIARERPTIVPQLIEVSGFSYPSGHTLFATTIYLTLAIIAVRHFPHRGQRLTIFALSGCVIGLVGFSRVYLGVHYPSDVASGLLLGASWAFVVSAFIVKIRPAKTRP